MAGIRDDTVDAAEIAWHISGEETGAEPSEVIVLGSIVGWGGLPGTA